MQYEMDAYPVLLGATYRFSRTDIVPYVSLAGGVAFVRQKGFYDYNSTVFDQVFSTCPTLQGGAGFEFYISPRIGIRLEASAMLFFLASHTTNTTSSTFPDFIYQANPITMRYASGLFVLF
jgi:hypothetical protein